MDRTLLCSFLQGADDIHNRLTRLENMYGPNFLGPKYEDDKGKTSKDTNKGGSVAKKKSDSAWETPTKPFVQDYSGAPANRVSKRKETIDVVSYNILSLNSTQGDFYRNLDGSVKVIDTEVRKRSINAKIVRWLEEERVICMQEVTHNFINAEENRELHEELKKHSYAVYSHFYNFMRSDVPGQTGYCTLGLAILVPTRLYAVKNSGLLRPWKNPVIPVNVDNLLKKIEARVQVICIHFKYCSVIFKKGYNVERDEAVDLLSEGIRELNNSLTSSIPDLRIINDSPDSVKLNIFQTSKSILQSLIRNLKDEAGVMSMDEFKAKLKEKLIEENELDVGDMSTFNIMKGLSAKKDELRRHDTAARAPFKSNVSKFSDRSVIILHIEDMDRNNLLLATVHLPCEYREPKTMTSLALKTKESILNWIRLNTAGSEYPMLLCGDFNSSPHNEAGCAYNIFTGDLWYDSENVDKAYTHETDYFRLVRREQWNDCLKDRQKHGCTCYGFTKNGLNDCTSTFEEALNSIMPVFSVLAEDIINLRLPFKASQFNVMCDNYITANGCNVDEITPEMRDDLEIKLRSAITKAIREKKRIFKPKELLIDHFFLRDKLEQTAVRGKDCPQSYDVVARTKGKPLPNLSMPEPEPSDHLPISLSLKFNDQDVLRRTRSMPRFMANEY